MLDDMQAFASFSVLRNLQLYSSTNGGDASCIGILLLSRLFLGYYALLPLRDEAAEKCPDARRVAPIRAQFPGTTVLLHGFKFAF